MWAEEMSDGKTCFAGKASGLRLVRRSFEPSSSNRVFLHFHSLQLIYGGNHIYDSFRDLKTRFSFPSFTLLPNPLALLPLFCARTSKMSASPAKFDLDTMAWLDSAKYFRIVSLDPLPYTVPSNL